jgi:hypothetical protein
MIGPRAARCRRRPSTHPPAEANDTNAGDRVRHARTRPPSSRLESREGNAARGGIQTARVSFPPLVEEFFFSSGTFFSARAAKIIFGVLEVAEKEAEEDRGDDGGGGGGRQSRAKLSTREHDCSKQTHDEMPRG